MVKTPDIWPLVCKIDHPRLTYGSLLIEPNWTLDMHPNFTCAPIETFSEYCENLRESCNLPEVSGWTGFLALCPGPAPWTPAGAGHVPALAPVTTRARAHAPPPVRA